MCDLFKKVSAIQKGVPIENNSPCFPDVSQLKAYTSGNNWWVSLNDVYKILENTSGLAHITLFAKKHDCIVSQPVNREWNQTDKRWERCCNATSLETTQPMIPLEHLQEMSMIIVNRTRKSLSQKSEVLCKLGLVVPESEIKVPIETSILDIFVKVCPFKVETQYRLGKYKLDAFIPRLKLAIQIDESNHSGYDEAEEKEYDTVIRDHQIVCIRFEPDEKHPMDSALKLTKMVWQRTLSPDFADFKKTHTLA